MHEVRLAVVSIARASQYEPDIVDRYTRAGLLLVFSLYYRSKVIDDFVCGKMKPKWFWNTSDIANR
jgi:hypothetical protein